MTSPRIRQAYLRFLADIICLRRKQTNNTEKQSSTFWARGMEQGDGNYELEDIAIKQAHTKTLQIAVQ